MNWLNGVVFTISRYFVGLQLANRESHVRGDSKTSVDYGRERSTGSVNEVRGRFSYRPPAVWDTAGSHSVHRPEGWAKVRLGDIAGPRSTSRDGIQFELTSAASDVTQEIADVGPVADIGGVVEGFSYPATSSRPSLRSSRA